MIVYGKCGQIDHIFICLGRQSLISYRWPLLSLKCLDSFLRDWRAPTKKRVPQPLLLRESIWNGLRHSMHSSFMLQTIHIENPTWIPKIHQNWNSSRFFFSEGPDTSFLDYIPSFWIISTHQSHVIKATINFPNVFPSPAFLRVLCVVCVSPQVLCRFVFSAFAQATGTSFILLLMTCLLLELTVSCWHLPSCKSDFFTGWFVRLICEVFGYIWLDYIYRRMFDVGSSCVCIYIYVHICIYRLSCMHMDKQW